MNASLPPRTSRSAQAPIGVSFVQRIDGLPEAVFPLLCPVRAGEWAEGWADSCELIWSRSGVAEAGCIFRTTDLEGPETVWITTEHDPDRGVLTLARVTPGLAAGTLRIAVSASGGGCSDVAIHATVVPTSSEGGAWAATHCDRTDLLDSFVWWERSMNHYLGTGQMLRRDPDGITAEVRIPGPADADKE